MNLVARLTAQVPEALRELRIGIARARGGIEVREEERPALVAAVLRLLFVLRVEAEARPQLNEAPIPRPLPPLRGKGSAEGEGAPSLSGLVRELVEEAGRGREAMASRTGAWERVVGVMDAVRERYRPSPGSAIFGEEHRWVEGVALDDASTLAVLEKLAFVDGEAVRFEAIEVEQLGHLYEALMGEESRRRAGSHYTSRAVAEYVVGRTLGPLLDGLGPGAMAERILELRVCDPAMGSGAMLLAACRLLGDRLVEAWRAQGWPDEVPDHEEASFVARASVARHCLYGLDKDPFAVDLARLSLWLLARAKGEAWSFADERLRLGDALVDRPLSLFVTRPFAWEKELGEVFERSPSGFDAIVGNPPWISYAGRAAQPLDPVLKAFYAERYEAFSGYRNLQGLFVERGAKLLREGGRLGLVLPSSMSEQEGYGPTRLAHDRLCEPDGDLKDLGEGDFEGVFQPSMILTSTKRATPIELDAPRPWPIERPDLDPIARGILAKMDRPPLPSRLFGERGIQTMRSDRPYLASKPSERHTMPLRCGSDVEPFLLKSPSFHAEPDRLSGRVRTPEAWREVRVVVRQTARYPMAALSDGLAFRNSLLAGFEDEEHPAAFLVAYLNSSPIRFLHYVRHRDARQGMPQVKVAHLRAIPAPPSRELVARLAEIGERLSKENRGIDEESRRRIDALVADAFDLTEEERARIARWRSQVR